LARYPAACGAAAVIFCCHKEKQKEFCPVGVLGNKKLPIRVQKKLPDVGISTGAFMLVREWDHLPGQSAEELASENADLSKMQLLQINF
jgi:hypothetical protein